jgi:hypothetical protein
MNILTTIPSRYRVRDGQFALGFLVLGGIAAYLLSGYIINDDILGLGLIAVALMACVLVVIILNNWRKGLAIFFAWLLFEDLVRKYLGNNMAIYFGKDVLVAVVYLSFFAAAHREKLQLFRPPFRVPLVVLIWFGVLQIFNPASPSFFYGLMGLKLFFYYVPLMIVGYSLIESEKDLRRFFFINLMLVLIIASLGLAQSILGHTFLNPSTMQEDIRELSTLYRVSPISGLSSYRPTSVFVSTGRYANFLGIGWLLVLAFTGNLILLRRKGQSLAFVVVIVTAAALTLCASRGAFMWLFINAVITSVAFLWGAPWRQREVTRVLRTIQRAAVGMIAAIVCLLLLFPETLTSRLAFYSETMSPDSAKSELMARSWSYPVGNFLLAFSYERWPYGYGIGTSGLGTQYISRIFHTRPIQAGVESGFGAIVIEMGIVGLLLWLVMSVAILVSAWKIVLKLRGSPWFPIGFVIFWFAFLMFFPYIYGGIMAYEDFVMNAYLWLLLGVLFRLPHLVSSEKTSAVPPMKSFVSAP